MAYFSFVKGCREALEAALKANVKWVIAAALVIAFLQASHEYYLYIISAGGVILCPTLKLFCFFRLWVLCLPVC